MFENYGYVLFEIREQFILKNHTVFQLIYPVKVCLNVSEIAVTFCMTYSSIRQVVRNYVRK